MKGSKFTPILSFVLILIFVSLACSSTAPEPTSTPVPTDTPTLTPTNTSTPTNTPRPSPTLRPTKTPNLAATQTYEAFDAETKSYFDADYLSTDNGRISRIDDFAYDWAQLGWYNWLPLGKKVGDFYMSAHFKMPSAYLHADTSGCGFMFAIQDNGDHYAVFLDWTRVLFLNADQATSYSRPVGLTRGTGKVKFENPAIQPAEADFTLIVSGLHSYVLVDNQLVGEYTLAQSKTLKGDLGLTILSGTNKDYGTRCEMTNIHVWAPN